MRSIFFGIIAAVALIVPVQSNAADWAIDASHSNVSFKVRHMMVSNVRGEFGTFSGEITYDPKSPSKTRATVSIDATSIDTHDEKRDGHLKSPDFFDTAAHPTITFESSKAKKSGKNGLEVHGKLTLRGKTRPVLLRVTDITNEVTDPWGNTKIGATLTTTINRQDFGVSWNKALDKGGVVVSDEVQITIELQLNKKQPKDA